MSNAQGPRVVLSSCIGRLHFVQLASALHHAGEHVEMITGWIPSAREKRLADLAGRIVGRANLATRLATRECSDFLPRDRLHSCALAEGGAALARRFLRTNGQPWASAQRIAWRAFGASSRRYIRAADVFHVRSGAGQGGAIARAREVNMRTVADHSIAHPDFMAASLNPEFSRYGLPAFGGSADPFWNLVLQDCHDADVVVVNSQFVSDTFQAHGFPAERIRVAYWGVRQDFLALKTIYPQPRFIRILFTGSFSVRKGAGYLLDALNKLDPGRNKYRLTVVGAVDEFEPIRRFHSVSDHDTFVGPVLQDRLKEYLRDSDLYVFPTLCEGCAQSAMEALAAGIPVVTTAECGLPAVSGEHACIVQSRSVDALASAIQNLADNRDLREHIGRNGASLVARDFSWQHLGMNIRRIHEELCSHSQIASV